MAPTRLRPWHVGATLAASSIACLVGEAGGIWLATRPRGSAALYDVATIVLTCTIMAGVFVVPGALIGLILRDTRRYAAAVLAAAALHAILLLALERPLHQWRLRRFERALASSGTLIAAIRSFEQAERRSPFALAELVPRYLPAVPGTGMGGYPRYEYLRRPENGDWGLSIPVGSIPMDWTALEYDPRGEYPPYSTRLGRWAYVTRD